MTAAGTGSAPTRDILTVKSAAIWYNASMTAKILRDVLERVEKWPEEAQTELAQIALEIDAGLGTGLYHATPKELAGIDRGLKAAREGRFATDDQVSRTFEKYRPA
jgi:predicted transcriptional regulator